MKKVFTELAPKAIGPYSQAVVAGDLIFCSGQIALNPETMTLIEGGIEDQTRQVLTNLTAVLEAAEASLKNVVKTTVYLQDINDFKAMNAVYADYMGNHAPARAAVEVAALPAGARVEIDAIASLV